MPVICPLSRPRSWFRATSLSTLTFRWGIILVLAIGITYTAPIKIGIVSFSGIAVGSIVGIALNAILPGKDYEFVQEDKGSTSVDFKV